MLRTALVALALAALTVRAPADVRDPPAESPVAAAGERVVTTARRYRARATRSLALPVLTDLRIERSLPVGQYRER